MATFKSGTGCSPETRFGLFLGGVDADGALYDEPGDHEPTITLRLNVDADLTGMEVTYERPEGTLISADGRNVMFQQVRDYNRPRWPDPAHP